jgi:hypothetical protein
VKLIPIAIGHSEQRGQMLCPHGGIVSLSHASRKTKIFIRYGGLLLGYSPKYSRGIQGRGKMVGFGGFVNSKGCSF